MTKKKANIQWAIIEEMDDADVCVAAHIMPVHVVDRFDTQEEAEKFQKDVESAGEPCVTDEDGIITGTYFGHTVSAKCDCGPELRDGPNPMYVHRMAQ